MTAACRDRGRRECQRTRRVQEQLAFAADKRKRRGGSGGRIRAGNSALPFGLPALSHNHQNIALVPRAAGLFICSLASHGGPHPPIICCRFMSAAQSRRMRDLFKRRSMRLYTWHMRARRPGFPFSFFPPLFLRWHPK